MRLALTVAIPTNIDRDIGQRAKYIIKPNRVNSVDSLDIAIILNEYLNQLDPVKDSIIQTNDKVLEALEISQTLKSVGETAQKGDKVSY